MSAGLREAVTWIMASPDNTQRFRENAEVIRTMFPELSDDETAIVTKLHRHSNQIVEIQDGALYAQQRPTPRTRSHGW
jgi:hypothetical protein